MNYFITPMQKSDAKDVLAIYQEGIETKQATFETKSPSWSVWCENHIFSCSLVARNHTKTLGWASLSPVSERCVYMGVAEVSIYVSASARKMGVGTSLLTTLIQTSETNGYWTLQSGVFPENLLSLSLHKRCGFREIGIRRRLGKLHGVFRDVVFLERRSEVVGV